MLHLGGGNIGESFHTPCTCKARDFVGDLVIFFKALKATVTFYQLENYIHACCLFRRPICQYVSSALRYFQWHRSRSGRSQGFYTVFATVVMNGRQVYQMVVSVVL